VVVTLFWRVFAINSGVLLLAALALAVSPATVSADLRLVEGLVLAVGVLGLVALNLALLRRTFAPLERVTALMRRVDPMLGRERELAIYRVAQESLTNVARHAWARSVEVALERSDGTLVLTVRDDGVGVDDTALAIRGGGGSGIRGMRERALLVGGRLAVQRAAPSGTEVRLSVPERSA
jgi:two-component system sensor histidine kinase UhpB